MIFAVDSRCSKEQQTSSIRDGFRCPYLASSIIDAVINIIMVEYIFIYFLKNTIFIKYAF